MFRVGQKVVCVQGSVVGLGHKPIVVGNMYTVRDVGDDGDPRGYWIRLNEVRNQVRYGCLWNGVWTDREPTYTATRFRPIVERPTDISIFTAMLNPAREASHV
jgi:hypothetical protein